VTEGVIMKINLNDVKIRKTILSDVFALVNHRTAFLMESKQIQKKEICQIDDYSSGN
jgi:hypothetical protein